MQIVYIYCVQHDVFLKNARGVMLSALNTKMITMWSDAFVIKLDLSIP